MANDREQKIRDVYEAIRATAKSIGFTFTSEELIEGLARAAVDVLDPVKRIELSDGFHAEIPDNRTDFYRFYRNGEDHGLLRRDIAEAWAAVMREIERLERARDEQDEKRERLREENKNLKQRIAALSEIIDALKPAPLKVDVDRFIAR
jgi:predicted ribosome quality control (RQC) complex YloA/Tae2 family protein